MLNLPELVTPSYRRLPSRIIVLFVFYSIYHCFRKLDNFTKILMTVKIYHQQLKVVVYMQFSWSVQGREWVVTVHPVSVKLLCIYASLYGSSLIYKVLINDSLTIRYFRKYLFVKLSLKQLFYLKIVLAFGSTFALSCLVTFVFWVFGETHFYNDCKQIMQYEQH